MIRDFIELLNIICQNPHLNMAELLQSEGFEYAKAIPEGSEEATEQEYAEFEL